MNLSLKTDWNPAFDPQFLDAYTGGDKVVRDQVLTLFLEQSALLLKRLAAARADTKAWHDAAHSLKGCASGVGAKGLAELAREAEQKSAAPDDAKETVLRSLEAAVLATADKVHEVLAG
jgi:HPt (histidine-containing phosphotransfer) domain-containing protein